MPEMPPLPVPNVAIVYSADNVAPAYRPIHSNVSVDVDAPANMDIPVDVDAPADVGTPTDVSTSVSTMPASMASMSSSRIRRHGKCEAERGNDGYHDGTFFQHFVFFPGGGFFRKLEAHIIILSNK